MQKNKVGIVILTYNSQTVIKACLASIKKATYPQLEIVVVDNNSSDQTVTTIKKSFPTMHIIKNKKNLGYAAGNNIGIRYLQKKHCDYILLLNPDTIIKPNLVNELLQPFLNDKKIGIVGCMITYVNKPNVIWFAGGYFNRWFCFTRHPLMDKNVNETNVNSGVVDFITGACMMLRTQMINKTKLLPEEYFLYFEDAFFCEEMRQMGYNSYLVAKPLVLHHVSTATGKSGSNDMTPLRAYYYARNPLMYIKNNVHGMKKISNYFGQFFIRLPYYSLQIMKQGNWQGIFAYLRGLKAGL